MIAKEVLKVDNNDFIEVAEIRIGEGLVKGFSKLIKEKVTDIKVVQGLESYVLINNEHQFYGDSAAVEELEFYADFYKLLGLPISVKLIIRDL